MREIKFRAWDKENKEMIYAPYIGSGIFIDLSGGLFWDEDFAEDRIILMQFTGLMDKNGKDIYEGDIVLYGERKSEVKFGYTCSVPGCHQSGFYAGREDFDLPRSEVIGNIYEDKELLEK